MVYLNKCMEFLNSKKFITILFIFLLCTGLSNCAKPKVLETKVSEPTTLETIGQLDAIATVLGCMFDPTPCREKAKQND